MKFSEDFLRQQAGKRQDWSAKGIVSGSGSPFKDPFAGGSTGKVIATGPGKRGKSTSKTKANGPTAGQVAYQAFIERFADKLSRCYFEYKRHGKASASYMTPYAHSLGMFKSSKDPYKTHFKGNAEHWEQVVVFYDLAIEMPELFDYTAAMPNGGYRTAKAAGMIKAEGGKSGYPDILTDLPKGVYHGLRIEFKTMKGSIQDNQKQWLNRLHKQGFYCALCFGYDQAMQVLRLYNDLSEGEEMPIIGTEDKWLSAA